MERPKRIPISYSLDREHHLFLLLDAAEQGHGNVSRSLQQIIERLAEARYGVGSWRRAVRERAAALQRGDGQANAA
jgi:hypothetical protein